MLNRRLLLHIDSRFDGGSGDRRKTEGGNIGGGRSRHVSVDVQHGGTPGCQRGESNRTAIIPPNLDNNRLPGLGFSGDSAVGPEDKGRRE